MQTYPFYHAKNKPLRVTSAATWFLIAALIAPLLAHAYLGSYLRFMADDFCSANVAREQGVLAAAAYWYMNWTGRYSANLLDSLAGLGGPRAPVHVAAAIAAWSAAWLFLASRLARTWPPNERRAFGFLLAALLPAVTLATIPSVEQSIYFGQSMRSVIPPLVGIALLFGLLAGAAGPPAQTAPRLWLRRTAMLALAFVSAGFSETAVVLQTGLLGLAAGAWLLLVDRERRSAEVFRLILAGLVGSLIGFAVMALAPGNAFRQAFFLPAPDLFELIAITAQSFREFIAIYLPFGWQAGWSAAAQRWLDILTPGIVGTLLGSRLILPGASAPALPAGRLRAAIALTPFVFAGLIFACFVPAAYAMSMNMPGRAFIVPVFAATLGMAVWGYWIGWMLSNRLKNSLSRSTGAVLITAGLLLLLGLNSLGSARLTLQKQPQYAAYAQSWSENDRRIAELRAISTGPITLPEVVNPVFGFSELTSDPAGFINQCMSGFYGIELRTTAPPVP